VSVDSCHVSDYCAGLRYFAPQKNVFRVHAGYPAAATTTTAWAKTMQNVLRARSHDTSYTYTHMYSPYTTVKFVEAAQEQHTYSYSL